VHILTAGVREEPQWSSVARFGGPIRTSFTQISRPRKITLLLWIYSTLAQNLALDKQFRPE
jgi:hypothetical protein